MPSTSISSLTTSFDNITKLPDKHPIFAFGFSRLIVSKIDTKLILSNLTSLPILPILSFLI